MHNTNVCSYLQAEIVECKVRCHHNMIMVNKREKKNN